MAPPRSLPTATLCICACALHRAAAFTAPSAATVQPRLESSPTARHAFALPDIFESRGARRTRLKRDILDLASATERGLTATEEQRAEMMGMFEQLERLNPTPDPLVVSDNKPSVNGDWSLDYTTSDSILGKGGWPRVGPIVQSIDTTTLSAKNSEVVKYAVLNLPRSVTAELSPVNGKLTDVKFKKFALGPVAFDAPDSFRGSLDITYLDDEVRLTRGDKGNIFVLTRM